MNNQLPYYKSPFCNNKAALFHNYLNLQSESPHGSELNALGIYLLCSLVFIVMAMIEFATVVLCNRAPSLLKCKRLKEKICSRKHNFNMYINEMDNGSIICVADFAAFWSYLFFYIAFNLTYWCQYY